MIPIQFCLNCNFDMVSYYPGNYKCNNNYCIESRNVPFNYSILNKKLEYEITHLYYPFCENNSKYTIYFREELSFYLTHELEESNCIYRLSNQKIPFINTSEFLKNFRDKIIKLEVFS